MLTSATSATSATPARRAVAAARRVRKHRLSVTARDGVSGLAGMYVTADRRRPGKLRPYRSRTTFATSAARLHVRVQDRAGNLSRWREVRVRGR